MELEEAILKLLGGEAILFAGAGCSIGASNLNSKPFMQGRQLAQHFANLSGVTHLASLEDASEAFVEKFGQLRLIQELKKEFTAKKIAPHHKALGSLPWKRIYTTNYDDVLEEAYKSNSKILTTITTGTNLIPRNQNVCIHLNGYIHTLTPGNVFTELKLVNTSYLTEYIANSQWAGYSGKT